MVHDKVRHQFNCAAQFMNILPGSEFFINPGMVYWVKPGICTVNGSEKREQMGSAENICHRLGYSECIEGNYRMWVERLDALRQLDSERLVATARSYWNDRHRHVLHLQPRKTNPLLYVAGYLRRLRGGKK